MGTNYYLKAREGHICPTCGAYHGGDERGLHIGKSSGGWCFSLRVYPDGNPQSEGSAPYPETGPIREFDDWMPLFLKYGIVNEYGDEVDVAGMIETIIARPPWYGRPLHRHEPEQYRCLGPGSAGNGTYDLMLGDFS